MISSLLLWLSNDLHDEPQWRTFINVYLPSDWIQAIFTYILFIKMMTLFNNQSYIIDKVHWFLAWDASKRLLSCLSWYIIFHLTWRWNIFKIWWVSTFGEDWWKDIFVLVSLVGFKHVETFTDFNIDEHNEDAERLFFIAKNKANNFRSDVYKVEEWFLLYQFFITL